MTEDLKELKNVESKVLGGSATQETKEFYYRSLLIQESDEMKKNEIREVPYLLLFYMIFLN